MTSKTGRFVRGIVQGVSAQPFQRDTGTVMSYHVGIQVEVPNRFGGMDQHSVALKLSGEHVKSGLNHAFEKLKGQAVEVPFMINEWTLDNGTKGFTEMVANGYQPHAIGK